MISLHLFKPEAFRLDFDQRSLCLRCRQERQRSFRMYGRARPVLLPFLKPLPPVLCRGLVSGLGLLSWEPPCATRWTTGHLISQGRREEDYLVQAEDHLPVSPSHILSLVRKGLLDADGVGVRCINQSRETSALGTCLLLTRWEGLVYTLAPCTTVPACRVCPLSYRCPSPHQLMEESGCGRPWALVL